MTREHHTEGTKVRKVSLQLRRSVRVSVFNLRDLSGLCVSFSQPGNGPFSVALFKEHHTEGTKVSRCTKSEARGNPRGQPFTYDFKIERPVSG